MQLSIFEAYKNKLKLSRTLESKISIIYIKEQMCVEVGMWHPRQNLFVCFFFQKWFTPISSVRETECLIIVNNREIHICIFIYLFIYLFKSTGRALLQG